MLRGFFIMYKSIVILLSVYVVFVAYLQIPNLMQYDSKRILQLLLFSLIGLAFVVQSARCFFSPRKNFRYRTPNIKTFVKILVAILLFSGLVSVIQAYSFKHALTEYTFIFLLLTLIYILTPNSLKSHYFLGKSIFGSAILFGTIYLIFFLGNYISSFFNPMILLWPDKHNFSLVINGVELAKEVLYFDNKRFFNHTQSWTLPILIGLLSYYQGLNNKKGIVVALSILISFWWMLLFATGVRGTLVGVVGSLLILGFFYKKDILQFLKNTIATAITGGIFYYVLFLFIPSINSSAESINTNNIPLVRDLSSGSVRLELWENTINQWMLNPFFGIGPMHSAQMLSPSQYAHPHNFYIQFLSEWGLFAFIALSILLIVFFKFIYKNYSSIKRSNSNKTIYLTFIWSLLVALIHAFFSGVMMTPISQVWLLLVVAWLLGHNRHDFATTFRRVETFKFVYLVLLLVVLYVISGDIFNLPDSYSETTLSPRFWVQGLFD